MSRFALVACLVMAVVAQPAKADDSYKIRIRKDEKPGDRYYVQESEKTTQKLLVTDVNGKILNKRDEQPERAESYEETIVGRKPGKRPHMVTRKYEKVVVKDEGKDVELPLHDKTVTIERKDGKYAFKLDEGELNDQILRFLNESFKADSDDEEKFDQLFFSPTAVKSGDSWNCDVKGIIKDLTKGAVGDIDDEKATGTGTLKEVYQKDGHPFGKIEIDVNVPIKSIGQGPNTIDAKNGSLVKIKMNIDACIDGTMSAGSMTAAIDMKVLADVPLPEGKKAAMSVTVNSTMTETRKELK
jgi:hypothetical protein